MKNQNTTQIAYIVTADYYTNGKPTTCKITVQPVNFVTCPDRPGPTGSARPTPAKSRTSPRRKEAAQRMTEIIERSRARCPDPAPGIGDRTSPLDRAPPRRSAALPRHA